MAQQPLHTSLALRISLACLVALICVLARAGRVLLVRRQPDTTLVGSGDAAKGGTSETQQRYDDSGSRGKGAEISVRHPWMSHIIRGDLELERRRGYPNTTITALPWTRTDGRDNRTGLLYNHNPKAAGNYIKSVLRAIVPNKRGNRLVVKHESQSSGHTDQLNAFVIGSVREPCSHLVSLWAFGSGGNGRFRNEMAKKVGKGTTDALYGVSSGLVGQDDVKRFQAWVRHPGVRGILAARFVQSYSASVSVDCFVIVEGDVPAELRRCLQMFVEEAKSEWPKATEVLVEFDKLQLRTVGGDDETNGTTSIRKNPSHHSECLHYFDAETAAFVERTERPLYEAFGWERCCAEQSSVDMPPPPATGLNG